MAPSFLHATVLRDALGGAICASLAFSYACAGGRGPDDRTPNANEPSAETLAGGFDTIWDLAWGPDDRIWVTERPGRISRVDPSTGEKEAVGSVRVNEAGEGGLMGLAFHPDFDANPWVYVAHTYSGNGGTRNRVVRMRYEPLITWTPTIAPAGIAYYDADRISGWHGSLLMTTLKSSALYRLTLSADGGAITAAERLFDDAFGRLRDVLVAPDGIVYLATSNRDGRGRPRDGDDRIVRVGR